MHRAGLGWGIALTVCLMARAASAQPQPEEPPAAPPEPAPPPAETAPEPPPIAGGTLSWGKERSASSDTGTQPDPQDEKKKPDDLPWHDTTLAWDQSTSAQTIGIGQDYQSRNPSYDMSLLFRPRYYLYEDTEQGLSLRGEAGLFHEFTDSDSTTTRGETSFTDAQLIAAYTRLLFERGDYTTQASLRAPILTFPTSKVSANNGTILGLGASVGIAQDVPLQGSNAAVLQILTASLRVGYSHTFTETTVPTNPGLARLRTDPEGRLIPSDQLSDAAFAEHEATLSVGLDLGISDRVTWGNSFTWRPIWKYELADAEICNVATGCVQAERVDEPQRFTVITIFGSELSVDVFDELAIGLGYTNLASQIGPDGQRRNILYGPDARFYLTVTLNLDEVYKSATGYGAGASRPNRRQLARGR